MVSILPGDLLALLWTGLSPIGRLLLIVQLTGLTLGAVPSVRKRLRDARPFAALLVGPPLLWILFEVSVGTILSCEYIGHPAVEIIYDWALRVGVVIFVTLALQVILAIQYVDDPRSAFPVLGVVVGILSISIDLLLVLLSFDSR